MMTDLDTAILVIKAACGTDEPDSVLEEGMLLAPHLPWMMAALGLAENDSNYEWAVVVLVASKLSI